MVAVTCRRHGLQTCPDTKKYCVRSCAVLACVQAGYQVPVVLVGLGLAFAEVAVRDVGKMAGARELAAGRKMRCRCNAFVLTTFRQLVRLEVGRVMGSRCKCGRVFERADARGWSVRGSCICEHSSCWRTYVVLQILCPCSR